jgi:hypothetical protein
MHGCLCEGNEMTDAEKPVIKKDYHWVKIDQTKQWNKQFLAMIGSDAKVIVTFVFDHNSFTNCCELTPSYELHLAGTEFTTSRELSEAEREELEDRIRVGESECDDVEYHHCSSIDDKKRSKPIRQFENCEDDVTIEDVIEYYKGNPW